jgi:hypothetical protein
MFYFLVYLALQNNKILRLHMAIKVFELHFAIANERVLTASVWNRFNDWSSDASLLAGAGNLSEPNAG